MAENLSDSLNPRLLTALDEARILLGYASQSGAELDAEIVATIVNTGGSVARGELSAAQESAFWSALNKLAKALGPVSVSSLRATMDSFAPAPIALFGFGRAPSEPAGGRSLARRAVRWYTAILVLTLAALLAVQIYWLFGTSITVEIQKNRKEIAETEAKQRDLQQRRAAIAAAKPAALKAAPAPEAAARSDSVEGALLQNQLDNLDLRHFAAFNLLKRWSRPWEGLAPMDKTCESRDRVKVVQCENIARYEASLVILDVLQRYILALLYGLLGASAYILRTLAAEIRARTYSEASNIVFRIRLYLGTLGGMVVAWFLTPEAADGLFRTLSPFALAFLAGYSVELLFAAMDRLIAAFTNK
jgi:hypothetical protein